MTNEPQISDVRFRNEALWDIVYFSDIQIETETILAAWLVSLEMKELHK